jgi:pimeloyl-ACP methyl ester carboxylesterase
MRFQCLRSSWLRCMLLVLLGVSAVGCNGASYGGKEKSPKPNRKMDSGYLRDEQNDRVIVFVHGVLGDARETWTAANGAYWPDLMLGDDAFKQLDIYVYDYPSPLFAVSYSIDELADNLRLVLESDGVFEKHKEVIFVCHSMGGLVARALLLKYQKLAPQVPMIYFFSTPTTGSEVADLANVFSKRNPQFEDMKSWRDSAYVGNLVRQWLAAEFQIKSYCAYEKQKTFGVKIVHEPSATNLCNQRLDPIDADHIDIVKPSDRRAIPYMALRQAVISTPPRASRDLPSANVGKISLGQFVTGKEDSGRFIEVLVNNTTPRDVVLSKFIYSRGVSSQEMELINICCLYCMEAWYSVQRGKKIDTSTPGTKMDQVVWFVRSEAESRFFRGRLHYAHGCEKLLFAQLEMNISVVAAANRVTKVGVVWPSSDREESPTQQEKQRTFDTKNLLAPTDTVCVYIGIEGNSLAYKLCRPDSEFDELFL